MANEIRYGKPSMTNLPPELGKRIFEQILNSPKVNWNEMHKKAQKLEKDMINELEKQDNE